MKRKCTGWAIVTTVERPDGTWYDETITDVDDDTASYVDSFLTEYFSFNSFPLKNAKPIVRLFHIEYPKSVNASIPCSVASSSSI